MGLLCWRGLAEIEWSIWRLQDEYGDVGAYFSTKADLEHMWGVQYVLRVWPMGEEFFWQCKKARRLLILPYARGRKAHCTRQLLTESLRTFTDAPGSTLWQCRRCSFLAPAAAAQSPATAAPESNKHAPHAASQPSATSNSSRLRSRAWARPGRIRRCTETMNTCKISTSAATQGVLNYVILRPLSTVVTVLV